MLFIHGNSSSSQCFNNQLSSDLAKQYRLHAVDLPGHGNTSKASSEDTYSIPGYATEILNHIEQHDLQNIILVGWSLGGHIALEMHAHEDIFKGIVIYGTPPLGIPAAMEDAFLPNEAVNIGFNPELDEVMAKSYASSFFKEGLDIELEAYIDDILKTDPAARANLVPSMETVGYADEIKVVKDLSIPIMIIHGEEEQLVSAEYIESLEIPSLWKKSIQYIPNTGHAPMVEDPQKFNAFLDEFAQYIR